jgi:hypothetical protein
MAYEAMFATNSCRENRRMRHGSVGPPGTMVVAPEQVKARKIVRGLLGHSSDGASRWLSQGDDADGGC